MITSDLVSTKNSIIRIYFTGGSALYIEAALTRPISSQPPSSGASDKPSEQQQGSLETTGHLGDVMKVSIKLKKRFVSYCLHTAFRF